MKAVVKSSGGAEYDEDSKAQGELAFLPERTCAICYQDQNPTSTSESEVMAVSGASGGVIGSAQTDVTNPYETIPCRCIYCFVCIATRLEGEEGEGWVCLRCGELVKECKPWAGDVYEETTPPTNRKTVSFSDEEEKSREDCGQTTGSATARSSDEIDVSSNPEEISDTEDTGLLSDGLVESHEWAQEKLEGSGSDVEATR